MAYESSVAVGATNANGRTQIDTAARDATFRKMFRANEQVWLLDEQYDSVEAVWRVDLLRVSDQGQWLHQRYKYDMATGVVFFMGESPVAVEQVRVTRRAARRFQ